MAIDNSIDSKIFVDFDRSFSFTRSVIATDHSKHHFQEYRQFSEQNSISQNIKENSSIALRSIVLSHRLMIAIFSLSFISLKTKQTKNTHEHFRKRTLQLHR